MTHFVFKNIVKHQMAILAGLVFCLSPNGAYAESAGLPQFNAEWFPSQLFWLTITFVVLFAFFSRIALPRIASTLETRETKVQGDRQVADELSRKAQSIRDSYEREMALARDKATEAVRSVDARIKEKIADSLYTFRTKFTQEVSRMEDDLARERDRLVDDMNAIAAEIAAHAASTILQAPADLQTAQEVVDTLNKAAKAA